MVCVETSSYKATTRNRPIRSGLFADLPFLSMSLEEKEVLEHDGHQQVAISVAYSDKMLTQHTRAKDAASGQSGF